MTVRYNRPRRLNLVSFVFLLAGLASLYGLFKFGPPYYRRWKAAGVVSDLANKLYAERRRPDETSLISDFQKELRDRFRDIGIDESMVQPEFQRSLSRVRVQVRYLEIIRHPLVNKTTTLEFNLAEEVVRTDD
jgi:hypothetical protein